MGLLITGRWLVCVRAGRKVGRRWEEDGKNEALLLVLVFLQMVGGGRRGEIASGTCVILKEAQRNL